MTQEQLVAENARLRRLQEQQVTALQAIWKCYTPTQISHARVDSPVWLVANALDDAGVMPHQTTPAGLCPPMGGLR
ncbi:hypothetical protein ACU4GI_47150 (plasmid) [Cupriavidus basilensis]